METFVCAAETLDEFRYPSIARIHVLVARIANTQATVVAENDVVEHVDS